MKINNSKDAAVTSGKWAKPDASFYNRLLEEDNYLSLIHEAFLMSGDVNKDTHYSSSGCKYPHHTIRKGELVVSAPGVRAAYARAKQMGVYHGKVKEHLDKHLKELGIFDEERHMEENFAFIESVLGIDEMIEEKSHGTLKNDFRYVYDANTGHKLKVVYSLGDIKIDYAGHAYNPEDTPGRPLSKNDEANDEVQKHITKRGNVDHMSHGQKISTIIDEVTGQKLDSAEVISYSASADPSSPLYGSSELSIGELQNRLKSNFANKCTIKVGDIDNIPSFKSTALFKIKPIDPKRKDLVRSQERKTQNRMDMAQLSLKYGRGVKFQDFKFNAETKPKMPVYGNPNKKEGKAFLKEYLKSITSILCNNTNGAEDFINFIGYWNKVGCDGQPEWDAAKGSKITLSLFNDIAKDFAKNKKSKELELLTQVKPALVNEQILESIYIDNVIGRDADDDVKLGISIGGDITESIGVLRILLEKYPYSIHQELSKVKLSPHTREFITDLEEYSVPIIGYENCFIYCISGNNNPWFRYAESSLMTPDIRLKIDCLEKLLENNNDFSKYSLFTPHEYTTECFGYPLDWVQKEINIVQYDESLNDENYFDYIFESKDISFINRDFEKQAPLDYTIIDTWQNKDVLKYIPRDWNYLNKKGEVAIVNDKLAGFIFVDKSGNIGPLKVEPEFRGHGLSEVLLNDAINKFKGTKLGVFSDNKVALRLYKKLGFEEYDRKEYSDGDVAIMMKLKNTNEESEKDYTTYDNSFEHKDPDFKYKAIDINSNEASSYITNDSFVSDYLDYLKDNTGEIYIDEDNKKLVGYVFVGDAIDKGFISTLYVNKEYRGYGFGSKLLQDAIGKYGAIDLVVDIGNKTAINMYKRAGFEIEKAINNGTQYYMKLSEDNKDNLIEKKWFITSSDGVDNCCIKVKGYDKPMRGRSSMISIRNNNGNWEVMSKKNSDGDYGVPGGGWNKHEDPKDAAIREINEETLTTVKDVKRMHTLIEYHEEVQQWVKDHVPEKDWWYGYYSAVFVGVYNGKFTGHVNAEDRESGYTWKPLTELNKFPPEYIEAINMYISQNFDESVDQSSITPGFHTKPVNDYTVVDFVSLTDDDYNKYPILKNITKYGYGEIIFIDDKIAGYVVVRKNHVIGPMVVEKEFRGYGLSEILLRDAINKFEGKSLGVYADNEVAIRLYQKFGFKTVETKMVNGDKAYMMELESVDADLAWIEEFVNNDGFRDDIFITEDVEINSPLDLLSWMKDIQYGWITRGGKVHNGSENIANDFYNNWHLQSPTQLASTKVGVCWDDVELERQWFEMNHYKYAIFYIILNDGRMYPTHTFLVYQMGRHHYWFEYSWEKYRGIHKYHSSDVLIKDVIMRHRQEYNDYDSSVSIHWLQEVPKYGCTVQQYMRYASKQPELDYENLPSKLFKEAMESMDEELLESTLALFMEETDEEEPPEMPAEDTSGENEESTEEPETHDNSELAQSEEEPPALTNEEETTLEEIKPKSLPKQTDENEKDKNGVNRKKLYIAFIEWCKEYNNKNTFGSVFDKDAFKVTYPFVPDEMRYFYRLANPMLCVLAGNLTFFPLADLRKINAKNTELETYMIFAATPSNDLRVFCTTDKKIYKANYEDNKIKLVNELGGTFDTYIQNMINKGDILNGSEEAMENANT